MATDRNRGPEKLMLTNKQLGDEYLIDYSYTQWRHAQMRQLEQNYADMNPAQIPFAEAGSARRRAVA